MSARPESASRGNPSGRAASDARLTDHGVLPNRPASPLSSGQRANSRPAEMMLELVSETVEQEIDVDALHCALVALLVRYHRAQATRGVARVS